MGSFYLEHVETSLRESNLMETGSFTFFAVPFPVYGWKPLVSSMKKELEFIVVTLCREALMDLDGS